ncbi:MAG: hypothetical protein NTX25_12830, partial [Proteobacteria bacterium]|nr:hypothetical protein [Pseudomonadota bacterium]
SYKIVPSDQGQLLADMDQRIIKALDLNTYQKRSIASFYEKELPLYLKVTPLQVLAFRPEQRELVRYEAQSSEPVASLKLKSGMRLVQQDGLFGIVTASEDGKTLQVKQIKGWSGDVFRGIDIKLPEDFQADRVGVAADFGSGLCLVFGGNSNIRRKLRQILVVNGSKEQSTQLIKAPEAQYFSQVLLTPESHKILILSRGLQDESVKTLRLGDPVTGEWKELAINYDMNSNKVDEAPVSKKDI